MGSIPSRGTYRRQQIDIDVSLSLPSCPSSSLVSSFLPLKSINISLGEDLNTFLSGQLGLLLLVG